MPRSYRTHVTVFQTLSVRKLAEHDTEMRFRLRAACGDVDRALAVLDKLDRMNV